MNVTVFRSRMCGSSNECEYFRSGYQSNLFGYRPKESAVKHLEAKKNLNWSRKSTVNKP